MSRSTMLVAFLLLSFPLIVQAGRVASLDKFNVYTVDCGTGLAVYVELPSDQPGQRPLRLLYDTGKGGSEGIHNDLVRFLASEEIGLKTADGDFEGDVIDYFVISHPHEDHYNGAKPVFDMFDVRNVIESKQSHSIKYLKRFKGPAINEIMRAKAAGKDAKLIIFGLPYPNGFDQPRLGKPYDEYAIAESKLPPHLKGKIKTKIEGVNFPFGADEVEQNVKISVRKLMGEVDKAMSVIDPEFVDGELECQILPIGVQYRYGRDGGFNVVHGDTIAPFDYKDTTSETYKEAWPYYRECDVNDASVTVQLFYKNATVLIPGDCEGRWSKPDTMVKLTDVFGNPEGSDSYTKDEILKYLKRDKPEEEQLPIIPSAERYIISGKDLRELAFAAFVTFDWLTPEEFTISVDGKKVVIPAKNYASPEDIPNEIIFYDDRNEEQKATLHPQWRDRLFRLHQDLKINRQKFNCLKTRFKGWCRGGKPRLTYNPETKRFRPNWPSKCWTVVNLVQITERIYYVDPGLANILAGFVMRSELFLEYMSPPDPNEKSLRGERHMIHVAEQIAKEGGSANVLKSDVIFFGHHGSFTSSSIGFIHKVDPNVGVISADDKSYSGSTLPDFSSLFWNMNTKHPNARAILHSIFFHADLLAQKRGEPVDEYAVQNRFSPSASKVFRARGIWPIPLFRTDLNDDLVNNNTLLDNILIETKGEEPIWQWSRHVQGQEPHPYAVEVENGMAENPDKYAYWGLELISAHPSGGQLLRPHDPSGMIKYFDVDGIAEQIKCNCGNNSFDTYRASETNNEDWELSEPEDWTLRAMEEPIAE